MGANQFLNVGLTIGITLLSLLATLSGPTILFYFLNRIYKELKKISGFLENQQSAVNILSTPNQKEYKSGFNQSEEKYFYQDSKQAEQDFEKKLKAQLSSLIPEEQINVKLNLKSQAQELDTNSQNAIEQLKNKKKNK